MLRIQILAAAAALFCLPVLTPAHAHEGMHVDDAYARVSSPAAQSGAAFMRLVNHSHQPIRLIEVRSDVAQRVELHTHEQDAQGVMRMIHVEGGFDIPAGSERVLERGGDHVMFLGLTRSLAHGDSVHAVFVFSNGEEVDVAIPVDLERQPAASMPGTGHSHGHGHHTHGH